MKLVGAGGQGRRDYLYRADVTMSGSAQLVLGQSQSRSHLLLFNTAATAMGIEVGCGAATATITSGGVSAITVTNAGFGFSRPPLVTFFGGGLTNDPSMANYTGCTQPNTPSPQHPAAAHCVMTGTAPTMTIGSIVVDDPGVGYTLAPYVLIQNDPMDPNGAAIPSVSGGIILPASMGAPIVWNGTVCPTEPISVIGTAAAVLVCRWMD
jgi:hypothetical protein